MVLTSTRFVRQFVLFQIVLLSALSGGCSLFRSEGSNQATQSYQPALSAPQVSVPAPYFPPPSIVDSFRPATQEDVDRTVAVRNKFIQLYNAANFLGAYSQAKPLASADYPINKSDVHSWRRIFVNVGDVLLLQRVASFRDDKVLFDFVTEWLGHSEHKCVVAAAKTASKDWQGLVRWTQCYATNRLQRSACSTLQTQLERQSPEIALLLGEPSGACR